MTQAGESPATDMRSWSTRAWLRFEDWWWEHNPLPRGRAIPKRVGRALRRWSVLRPVLVDLEPGVRVWLDPGDLISRSILVDRHDRWEADVWNAVAGGLAPGAVMLDIGAHIGYMTLKAARVVGAEGRVIAFEPNPRTADVLRRNIAASGAGNVEVIQAACAADKGEMVLFVPLGDNSGVTSLAASHAGPATPVTVPVRRLDDVVEELGLSRVDVIKIDVEGAETLALRGAAKTLTRFRPRLVAEVLPEALAAMGTSPEELDATLAAIGYTDVRQVDGHNREYRMP